MDFIQAFTPLQFIAIGLIFIWTGFVRTGIGFGGAALGLPLLLLVDDKPLIFLPIIGFHLLFFSSLTLSTRIHNVNWSVIYKVLLIIIVPKVIGILGLFNFPNRWLVMAVFCITLIYGLMWLFNYVIKSQNKAVDFSLLVIGGYVSGTSLIGAPLMVAVISRYVERSQLRETLFVLWVILVSIKMSAFVVYEVDLQWQLALLLLPLAGVGHYIGLRTHEYLLRSDTVTFHRVLGAALIVVSLAGLLKYLIL
ncbi:MAG TPA: sulfite exporter TauE/SafE family protein [Leucothrix mucor]|nr:sulfite exporter TauE/SafE family protein [Leucothrix mucor]